MSYYHENEKHIPDGIRICKTCGVLIKPDCMFCSQCGTSVAEAPKNICGDCQYENKPGMLFCTQCGARLSGSTAPAQPAPPAPAPIIVPAPAPAFIPPAAIPTKNICANCQYENKPGMLFCTQCGARLSGSTAPAQPAPPAPTTVFRAAPAAVPAKNVCGSCHYDNKPGTLFCTQCGARLGSSPAPAFVRKPAPAPVRSQARIIAITRDSQFVCAANTYKVIVNGLSIGNISGGQTLTARADTDVITIEIICTTVMINKRVAMKLRAGENPKVTFKVQWPGDIFPNVQDAAVLEISN